MENYERLWSDIRHLQRIFPFEYVHEYNEQHEESFVGIVVMRGVANTRVP